MRRRNTLIEKEKSDLLKLLDEKFEEKTFMPNINHVRDFLWEERPIEKINSRKDEKKRVFVKLAGLDITELKRIYESGYYGPPKRLAAYATAIENFKR